MEKDLPPSEMPGLAKPSNGARARSIPPTHSGHCGPGQSLRILLDLVLQDASVGMQSEALFPSTELPTAPIPVLPPRLVEELLLLGVKETGDWRWKLGLLEPLPSLRF